ncbi:MAG TPA: M28 family peptidase [Bacteroidota bacterium]|nr:M28 family peptidase [Bacteroidota bacterium]
MQRTASIVLLCVILIPAFCLGQTSREKRFSAQVSQERLLQTVRDLVKLGNRLGGTASGDKAAAFVLKKFKSYRLSAVSIEDPVRLTYTNDGWILQVEEPRFLKGLFKNERPAGFSPSVSARKIPLVLLNPDVDFVPAQVESVAVLVPFPIAHDVYEKFVEAGALCLLSYASNPAGSYENWSLLTDLPSSSNNPIPVFNISVRNGEALKKELIAEKKVVIKYSTKSTVKSGRPKTIVATLNGVSDEYYLVCGHGDSDCGGPGADDNASGVSGVLELARVLNGLVGSKSIPKPKKSIKFVVWGSEYFSAESYVTLHSEELGKILGVFNYDEIGTGKTRNCLYFEGNDISQNEGILRVVQKVSEEYVGKKGFWHEATTNPAQGGTDSYVFLPDYLDKLSLTGVEVPAITIYSAAWGSPKTLPQTQGWSTKAWKGHPDSVYIDYSPYYHSSMDVPATTTEKEPFNMLWAVKAVGITLLRLAW